MGKALTLQGVEGPELLLHILVAQGMLCVMVGFLLVLVAELDGLYYMRFMPYQVGAGFVSGIGILIFDGGLELGCGQGLQSLVPDFFHAVLNAEVSSAGEALVVQLVLTLASAVVFLLLREVLHSFSWGNAVRLPLGLALISGGVYSFLWLHPLSHQEVEFWGIFLSGLVPDSWTLEWRVLAHLHHVKLGAIFSQPCVSLTVSYAALSTLAFTFFTSGMRDMDKDSAKADLTKEIRFLGKTNVLVGLLAGVPVSPSLKVFVVMKDAGARTRTWVCLLGSFYMLLYFDAVLRSSLSVIPKCAFGGLVVSLGFEFLTTSLVESRERIAVAEWRLVVITCVLVYFNVLMGILFGVAMTTVFFMVEYSAMTGVTQRATMREVRSLVERDDPQTDLLDKHGYEVAVFWCSGYIFFGTANDIVDEVQAWLDSSPTTRIVILDFEQVPAVDASGVQSLITFASACEKRRPAVHLALTGLVRRLHLSVERAASAENVKMSLSTHRLEATLEWAEERVLKGRVKTGKVTNEADLSEPKVTSAKLPSRPSEHKLLAAKLAQKMSSGSELQEMLEEFLADIAPSAEREERAAVCQQLSKFGSKLQTFEKSGQIYAEGATAKYITYVVSGSVNIYQSISADEALAYKLPRHHLNGQKGDAFAFEEEIDVRVRCLTRGALLGATEFGAYCSCGRPQWHASAHAACPTLVLQVPFSALEAALESNKAVGHAVMLWLFKLASLQVLDVLQGARVKPYRRIDQEGVFKRVTSTCASSPAIFSRR
ncbi:unnamed protein product [Effrenium voratum]|uniref:STAS domain-containing protein n=1 Tax=Effrenium voratum TaxID=2562239 RepID=A0AA36INJ2_9DINO|nr:unnamed protein product [Effrenium voratum]CAJ1422774.1 unnamed protein product [Effrenium voratum]